MIVLCARPPLRFAIYRHTIEPRLLQRMDTTILLVAGLPCRQAKPSAHIIFALDRIVAREGMSYKTSRRARLDTDRKRPILRSMAGTGR
jgi:hypothetical protein